MLPGAFASLKKLTQTNEKAAWCYGAAQAVDRAERPVIQLRPALHGNCFVQTMAGEWLPLMASLIKADIFFAVGGFNPLLTISEDIDLLRRIALQGDLVGTTDLVTCIGLGAENSTTDQARHAEFSRWAQKNLE